MAMVQAAEGFERLVVSFSRWSAIIKLVRYCVGVLVKCKTPGELEV